MDITKYKLSNSVWFVCFTSVRIIQIHRKLHWYGGRVCSWKSQLVHPLEIEDAMAANTCSQDERATFEDMLYGIFVGTCAYFLISHNQKKLADVSYKTEMINMTFYLNFYAFIFATQLLHKLQQVYTTVVPKT